MSIEFYSTQGRYGEFSNFAPFPFHLNGHMWPTSEHYFQAQKFDDEAYRERIRAASSPMVAARLGRSRAMPLRGDWEEIKLDVMRTAVITKFTTHPQLAELLLGTGDEPLVEAAPGDSFWGSGSDDTGSNWLGRILMEVRDHLRRGDYT